MQRNKFCRDQIKFLRPKCVIGSHNEREDGDTENFEMAETEVRYFLKQ